MKKKFLRFISLVTIVCISFSFSSCNMLKRIFVLFEDKITYEEQEKTENEKLLRDIVDTINGNPKTSEDKNETMLEIKDELKQELENILNITSENEESIYKEMAKKEELMDAKSMFDRFVEMQKEYIEVLIDSLMGYSSSRNLGNSLDTLYEAVCNRDDTTEPKKQLSAVLNDMRNDTLDSVGVYDYIIADIENAIADADAMCYLSETEPHALKDALRGFIDNLNYLRDEIDVEGADFEEVEKISKEKFNESEKAMVEAIEDIKDLETKVDSIQEKLDEEIKKIEDGLLLEESSLQQEVLFKTEKNNIVFTVERSGLVDKTAPTYTDARVKFESDTQVEIAEMLLYVENKINTSKLSPSTKDEILDIINVLKNSLGTMLNDSKSGYEMSAEIEGPKGSIASLIKEEIKNTEENAKIFEYNELTKKIYEAIEKYDTEILGTAFNHIENKLKNENGDWLEGHALDYALEDIEKELDYIIVATPDCELKDILQNWLNEFDRAIEEASKNDGHDYESGSKIENNQNQQYDMNAIDQAIDALDKAKEHLTEYINYTKSLYVVEKDITFRLGNTQRVLVGLEKLEKPLTPDENTQENEPKEELSKENLITNIDIYIPRAISFDDLLDYGIIEDQYDIQYGREGLGEEERIVIYEYYLFLVGNY